MFSLAMPKTGFDWNHLAKYYENSQGIHIKLQQKILKNLKKI